jgi:hypothetical protein
MHISYTLPLSKAWNRMKKALFQPFDLNKWLRVGFTAFLAGLVDCNGGNGGGNKSSFGDHNHWDEFFRFPQTAWDWLTSHPLMFNLIILGVVFFIAFVSVLMWLSSRGKFMFLHNVVKDSADISKPWHEFRREGNSLFVWQFIYNWLVIAVVVGLMFCFFNQAKELYYGDFPAVLIFWKIAGMIGIFLGFMIVAGYISLYLKDFVVPMMYKDRVGVFSGWLRFLVLFSRNPLTFIVYGLFIFGLGIVTVFIVIFFALFTCCIGLLLLIIPYIGAVVLLPVSYTFRALSIEFLAQFGEDYNVFPKVEETREEISSL